MMRRFAIMLSYDGTNYCGWQRQAGDLSIQALLEEALQPLNGGQPVKVIGAGRTDSGVHARAQVAHFDLESAHSAETIRRALNATLPGDIYVRICQSVDQNFHARFGALRREYKYQILLEPSVFEQRYAWLCPYQLDFDLLQQAAEIVQGEHDFTNLCRRSTEAESKLCTVYESYWERADYKLIYTIQANRFLHSMVRMIVGAMTEVARGKYPLSAFKNLLGKNDRPMQVYTAPAKGLILWSIEYKEQLS
jgi:tRNA pseudouridine38-40 synthase